LKGLDVAIQDRASFGLWCTRRKTTATTRLSIFAGRWRSILPERQRDKACSGLAPQLSVGLSLERDGIGLNHHRALASCLSMIFSENRFTLFRIML
jgi:hypothetical protein